MSTAQRTKPAKPRKDFPLFAHASGKWAKKFRGKMHYFGRWEDPQSALREYEQWLKTKSQTPVTVDTIRKSRVSLASVANAYLNRQFLRVQSGEIQKITFENDKAGLKFLLEFIGRNRDVASLGPSDFLAFKSKIAERRNPFGVANEVQRVRAVFNWATAAKLIDAVEFGPDFRRPNAKACKRHRRDNPRDPLSIPELLEVVAEADIRLRAMILLGLNGGCNGSDIVSFTLSDIDVDSADSWITAPRAKTLIDREFQLWNRTKDALADWLAVRPDPRSHASQLFFISATGLPCQQDAIGRAFTKVTRSVGSYRDRESFYGLRHVFATVASETGDTDACDTIMGHAPSSKMRMNYISTFPRERLVKVTDHVESRIFGGSK